jgi:hypothetical protein
MVEKLFPDHIQYRRLREQLDSLSFDVKENARVNYLVGIDTKIRDLQTHQCEASEMLQKLLRKQMEDKGIVPEKFRIGGFENGTYERFFKVEPREYMTKPQFLTGIFVFVFLRPSKTFIN